MGLSVSCHTRLRACVLYVNNILARYYGIFWDWDGAKTYSKAELAERQGLTLCESTFLPRVPSSGCS